MNASARLFVGWAKVWCASQQTTAKILRWVKEDCRTGKCAPHKSCFSLHLLSCLHTSSGAVTHPKNRSCGKSTEMETHGPLLKGHLCLILLLTGMVLLEFAASVPISNIISRFKNVLPSPLSLVSL